MNGHPTRRRFMMVRASGQDLGDSQVAVGHRSRSRGTSWPEIAGGSGPIDCWRRNCEISRSPSIAFSRARARSKRPDLRGDRNVRTPWPPSRPRLCPERFIRDVTRTLFADSTAPEPIAKPVGGFVKEREFGGSPRFCETSLLGHRDRITVFVALWVVIAFPRAPDWDRADCIARVVGTDSCGRTAPGRGRAGTAEPWCVTKCSDGRA